MVVKKSASESEAKNHEKALKAGISPMNVPEYCDGLPNPCTDPACARFYYCDPVDPTATYAGINITYETASGMLRFNSTSDVNAVLDQLETEYETYNQAYEDQYSSLTEEQMDSVDLVNNFDEFYPIRQFEAMFSGFSSLRNNVENIENTWLNNNMTGFDPDSVDITFDDVENAIFNNNYQVKIGGTIYQLSEEGTLAASQSAGNFTIQATCITNKKRKERFDTPDGIRRFKLKVSINSWVVRSGVKGKVVSFKKNNDGKWKRSRTKLAVYCSGTIYNNQCSGSFPFNDREPISGVKKKRQIKTHRHQAGTIWRTYYGQIGSSFEAPGIATASLILQ